MSTASIVGNLGLPSLRDMISAVGAAARIHNRPERMAWNSEDGGPPVKQVTARLTQCPPRIRRSKPALPNESEAVCRGIRSTKRRSVHEAFR